MRRKSIATVLILGLLALAGCGGTSGRPAAGSGSGNEPIKIGFVGGLTGPLAEYTTEAKQALDWKVDEINQKGGVLGRPIKMIYSDTKIDPQSARQAVERMVTSDKVVAIIGDYFSPNTAAFLPLLDQYQVPAVSPNSNATNITTSGSKYIFRVVHSSLLEAETLAHYAVEKKGNQTFVILGGSDGFSKANGDAFANALKTMGKGRLLGYDSYDRGTTKDFTNLLLKYKDQHPDAIFLAGGLADGALIAKQARDLGIKAQLYGSNAQARPGFFQIAGPAAVGTILINDYPGDATGADKYAEPGTKAFIKEFQAHFNKVPNYDDAHAVDSLMLIVQSIEAAKSTKGSDLREQLLKVKDWQGAVGNRRILPNGDSRATIYMIQIQPDGKWTVIDSVKDDGK